MTKPDNIRRITAAAAGQWPFILARLDISVPDAPGRHAPCPACGGKDRFRFDDNGRGSHICNQCGAGDGLDLIQKVRRCNAMQAARLVAGVLPINNLHGGDQPRAEPQQVKAHDKRQAFITRYQQLAKKATPGESRYLLVKGLEQFIFPILPDGSILLPLMDESAAVTAAQTLSPEGKKRLLTDSVKRGSFYPVNALQSISEIILAEGLATALSVHLLRPEALTAAAIDAGNLIHVAILMRRRYPQADIIIAGDNDSPPDGGINTGRLAAVKAAAAVNGRVALPPGNDKADWDDYRQQHGLQAAAAAFSDALNLLQPETAEAVLPSASGTKPPYAAK